MLDGIIKDKIITLEENVLTGGFGSAVSEYYKKKGKVADIYSYGILDNFVKHGSISFQQKINGLDYESIINDLTQKKVL